MKELNLLMGFQSVLNLPKKEMQRLLLEYFLTFVTLQFLIDLETRVFILRNFVNLEALSIVINVQGFKAIYTGCDR